MASDEISPEDAALVLHKWITESTKLQASLICPSTGSMACVAGVLKSAPNSTLFVIGGDERDPESPTIRFELLRPCIMRYGDDRVVKDSLVAADLFQKNFIAALTFAYSDGTVLALFEYLS